MPLKYLNLFFVLLFPILAFSQKNIRIEEIKTEEGSSLPTVNDLVTDKFGFIWIASENGLFRYDGYSIIAFRKNHLNKNAIPFNNIRKLFLDKKGILWLIGEKQVATFYNEKANSLKEYEPIYKKMFYGFVSGVWRDMKDRIWITQYKQSSPILVFNPQTGAYREFNIAQRMYNQRAIEKIGQLLKKQAICEISNPGDFENLQKDFILHQSQNAFIFCSGEKNKTDIVDFGTLSKNNQILWSLNAKNYLNSGGFHDNILSSAILKLEKGKYQLTYKSNGSHSSKNWIVEMPKQNIFQGIKMVAITDQEKDEINQLNLQIETNKDTVPLSNFVDIAEDYNGNLIFIAGNKIARFNLEKDKFQFLSFGDESDVFFRISALNKTNFLLPYFNYSNGKSGAVRFDASTDRSTDYLFNSNFFKDSLVYFSVTDIGKNQFILGSRKGLRIYDVSNCQLGQIFHSDARVVNTYSGSAIHPPGNSRLLGMSSGLFFLKESKFINQTLPVDGFSIFLPQEGKLWISCTMNQSLIEFDPATSQSSSESIPDFDKSEGNKYFGRKIITDFIKTKENLALTKGNQVLLFDVKKRQFTNLSAGTDKTTFLKLIYYKNNLLVFANDGIYECLEKEKKINKISSDGIPFDQGQLYTSSYKICYVIDDRGRIWLRNSAGIRLYDISKNKIEWLKKFEQNSDLKFLGNIFFNQEGEVLTSTPTMLYKIDQNSFKIDSISLYYTLEYSIVGSLAFNFVIQTKKGEYWVYSSNGVHRIQKDFTSIEYYSIEQGLSHNVVPYSFEDKLGDIWFGTSNGISKYSRNQRNFVRYNKPRDLYDATCNLRQANDLQISDSLFYFPTSQGIVLIKPEKINKNLPKLLITQLKISGKELEENEPAYTLKKLYLNHNQNSIEIEFAGIEYSDPQKHVYAYMLKGLEKQWTTVKFNRRYVKYAELDPGKYEFYLKATNNDGVWTKEELKLEIVVKSPFWKTIWFYTFEFILIILILRFLYIKRTKKLENDKNMLEMKVQLRTQEIQRQKKEIETKNYEILVQNDLLEERNQIITTKKEELEDVNFSIMQSMNYAKRIQKAVMPRSENLAQSFSDFFIINKPRDVVSGDFFWYRQISLNEHKLSVLAVADCTGHGIPGALVSMLGISLLNEVFAHQKPENMSSNLILDELRVLVKKSLNQKSFTADINDGFDISLIILDQKEGTIQFSGANHSIFIIQQAGITEIKGTKNPISAFIAEKPFEKFEWDISQGDTIYMMTDGFTDQIGGPFDKKFMTQNFRDMILMHHAKSLDEQSHIYEEVLNLWTEGHAQTDDILLIGLRI